MTWRTAVAGLAWLLGGASAAPADHVIAVVATGGSPHQPFGAEVVEGASLAVAAINRAGGLLGAPVRIAAWSEDCTRERAATVAAEIVRSKPAVVVGHLCAGAAIEAVSDYAEAGLLAIVPGVRTPSLTAAGGTRLVLRLGGRDDRFAVDTARFIAIAHAGKPVAIVADRTRQAGALAASLSAALGRSRVPVALEERIESTEKSYAAVAERIRASKAGVVVMPAQPIELGVLAASLREAGVTAPIVGSEILAVPSVQPTAEREGEGLVLMLPWTGLEEVAGVAAADRPRIAVRIRAQAAVEAWAGWAMAEGTVEPGRLAAAARKAPVPTAVGPLSFDEAGDAAVPSFVPHVWRGGAWEPIRP